jgi:exopolysaccharide production protein ExoZ
MDPSESRQVLSALQGLRGAAALLVVLDHAHLNFVGVLPSAAAPVGPEMQWVLGGLGVAIFFVISGFIMIYAHEAEFGRNGATKAFFAKRAARIVPFYALMTLIYAIRLHMTERTPGWADLIRSILFIPFANGHEPYGHPVLGQGWTLNYEALFYLIFGLSLLFRWGIVVLSAVVLGLCTAGWFGVFPSSTWLAFWSQPDILYFLAGVGIGYARRWVTIGLDFTAAFSLSVAVVAAAAGATLLADKDRDVVMLVLPLTALVATAICAWARERDRPSVLRAIAETIGNATFAIYLTHTFIIGPASKLAARTTPDISIQLFLPVVFFISVGFGIGVHHLVELPLINIWRRIFGLDRRMKVT